MFKNTLLFSVLFVVSIISLNAQQQKQYIIQVAYVEKGYNEASFQRLKAKQLGNLINEPSLGGAFRVYLVGKNNSFLTASEAREKLKEVKKVKGFEGAFIINFQNILPLSQYASLVSEEDRLILTISLREKEASLSTELKDYEQNEDMIVVEPQKPKSFGYYTLQLSANENQTPKKHQLIELLDGFKLPRTELNNLKPLLVVEDQAGKGKPQFKWFYKNFGQNLNEAIGTKRTIENKSGCQTNKNGPTMGCPLLVYIDRTLEGGNNFPSIRQMGNKVFRYYTLQLGVSSSDFYDGDQSAIKEEYLKKFSKLIASEDDIMLEPNGNGYFIYFKKYLRYNEALAMIKRFKNNYASSGVFVKDIPNK